MRLLLLLLLLTRARTYCLSRVDYVEMKRKIYAPDSKPIAAAAVPKNPYNKSAKPFNAWQEELIGPAGFPKLIVVGERNKPEDKKRKAEGAVDGVETRTVNFDSVTFEATKTGGVISLVDVETLGTAPGQWPAGRVVKFIIAKKDGETTGTKENGEYFNFGQLKTKILDFKPVFVTLLDSRPIAALPTASSAMAVDAPTSEFPARLTAPPTIATATPAVVEAKATGSGPQEYPAKGQASFKEPVTDEKLEELKTLVATWEGRTVTWTRATGQCSSSPSTESN